MGRHLRVKCFFNQSTGKDDPMKTRFILLLLCVFIAGVFFGIWLDWSAWKQKVGAREMAFELEDNGAANLRVHSGDTVSLVSGGSAKNPLMNFFLYSPCVDTKTPSTNCVIADGTPPGLYPFACVSDNGYTCPDPGIQQTPASPLKGLSYLEFVETDLHLVGVPPSPAQAPEPVKAPEAHATASSTTAYVGCNAKNVTTLYDTNGEPLPLTIAASSGQSVFWSSPRQFTLTWSNYPANLCSTQPTSGGPQQAVCAVTTPGLTGSYVVLVQSCGPSAPETLTTK
jgi:hypothetical protein